MKPFDDWYQQFDDVENVRLDLQLREDCDRAVAGATELYNLAADMGGMGFIENNKALCMLSVLINTHLLMSSQRVGVERYFFASSACVYAADKQKTETIEPLREEDAYPRPMETGTLGKLFGERMFRHFREDFGLTTRVARFHNVYGPTAPGPAGGRRPPRRSAARSSRPSSRAATRSRSGAAGTIRARSCTSTTASKRTQRILHSDVIEPLNLGSDESVTINQLVDIAEQIAASPSSATTTSAPRRASTAATATTRASPSCSGGHPASGLADGLERTYR